MDNSFIIENLLHQKEGIRLELKAQPDIESIAKTITAFINTIGGDIIIGLDNKKVIGVENASNWSNTIKKVLVEQIKPNAPISIQVITYKKKELILISVWEGAKKPYQYKGIIYNRVGQISKTTSVDNLSYIINERKKADFHWERMPVLGAELEDLDISEVNQTLVLYKEYKSNVSIIDTEDFLIQMGLLQNGSFTNACIVLFGKNPSRFIPQSRIRITIYPSKSTGNLFLDDKIFEDNIFKNINSIFNYLDITFGKSLTIDGILRKEKLNYPLLAIREGVLNAIVHRDYNSINGFLQISIYTNRTEISNYGGLPDGITIKDLKIEHSSILRNPDIAQISFIRKYIEMLGGGTLRMINDCQKNGFNPPEWLDKDNITKVIFHGINHNKKIYKINEGVSEGVNEGVSEWIREGVKLDIEGLSEGVNENLIKIINYLKNNPVRRVPEIAEHLKKGISTVERFLKILKNNNLIEFKGVPKTGGYKLKNKNKI